MASAPRTGSGRPPRGARVWLRRAAWAWLDVVLPPRCAGCRRLGARICCDCWAGVNRLSLPVCPACGCPLAEAESGCWCQPATRAALDGLRAAAFHEGPLRKVIHRLKYQHDIGLAEALGPLLEDCWRAHGLAANLLVPVPLAPARRNERGYNQAELLAETLGARVGIPVAPGALGRVRETPTQVGRGWSERYANVSDAFRADADQVRGRTVALVDDVCTSGATLTASAIALRAAGAAGVWGVAVARPRRSSDNAVNSEAR